jgi:hypothetical protein
MIFNRAKQPLAVLCSARKGAGAVPRAGEGAEAKSNRPKRKMVEAPEIAQSCAERSAVQE